MLGANLSHPSYKSIAADDDNVIPILPGTYFANDIVKRFIQFVEVSYGKDTLEENLNFVADALLRKTNESSREAIRRYFLNYFYKDHVQTYKSIRFIGCLPLGKKRHLTVLSIYAPLR